MKQTNKKSRYLVLYSVVIIALLVAVFALNQATKSKDQVNQIIEEEPPISSQPVMGNEAAKVKIVEFGDYKCPSCKAWGEQIFQQLQKDYIDTGKAQFSYINVLFHGEESKLAALASESINKSNPEDFWNFHKLLFNEQPEVDHDGLWITEDKLIEVAKKAVPSIDTDGFLQNMTSDDIQRLVDEDSQLVKRFNINQTPTIMINNIVITNPFDYPSITAAIEQELSK